MRTLKGWAIEMLEERGHLSAVTMARRARIPEELADFFVRYANKARLQYT